MEDLGGPGVHSRNGVCQLVAADEPRRRGHGRASCSRYLPSQFGGQPPDRPAGRGRRPRARRVVPAEARNVYDVRDVAERDRRRRTRCSSCAADWARNMVTALARIDGRPVGVVANQPRHLGGVIDARRRREGGPVRPARATGSGCRSSSSSTRPGSCRARGQERAGVIRHGASLLHAFAGARVPKLTVVLRKAYGGAVITMNSRDLGADLVFAWPGAEIGIMAARQAVGIVHRRRLAEADGDAADLRDRARGRLRRRAPDRRRGRGGRVRRRGDRAAGDARPPRLGAALAGGTMTDRRPVRDHRPDDRPRPITRASSRCTSPSATASPPAPAARPARRGRSGSANGLPARATSGSPSATSRSRGRPAREVLEQLRARRSSSSPTW